MDLLQQVIAQKRKQIDSLTIQNVCLRLVIKQLPLNFIYSNFFVFLV